MTSGIKIPTLDRRRLRWKCEVLERRRSLPLLRKRKSRQDATRKKNMYLIHLQKRLPRKANYVRHYLHLQNCPRNCLLNMRLTLKKVQGFSYALSNMAPISTARTISFNPIHFHKLALILPKAMDTRTT